MTEAGAEGQDSQSNQKLSEKIKQFSSKHPAKITLGILALGLVGFVIFCAVSPPEKIGWTGFKRDQEVSTTTKTGATGQETTTTTKEVSGKTLWDWMSLILAPVTLTGLGFWFQYSQDKARADREEADENQAKAIEDAEKAQAAAREKAESKRAAENQREQALEIYLDRISDILLSQQLLSLDPNKSEDKARLVTALDVIRARTLVILQRFNIDMHNADGERKRSVLLFLYDAELIGKSEQLEDPESGKADTSKMSQTNQRLLRLEGADLSRANLSFVDLNGIDLKGSYLRCANLSHAILSRADLSHAHLWAAGFRNADLTNAKFIGADLVGADFSRTNLSHANFSDTDLSATKLITANLSSAYLSNAYLSDANLGGAIFIDADLSNAKNLTEAQLAEAKLCHTKLPPGIGLDPNRDCEALGIEV